MCVCPKIGILDKTVPDNVDGRSGFGLYIVDDMPQQEFDLTYYGLERPQFFDLIVISHMTQDLNIHKVRSKSF